MPAPPHPIILATRGSPLALAQTNAVLASCRALFPALRFALKIFKTTGDKLQKASLAQPAASLPKGLFTKELELALLAGEADAAVHSLKDLPTDLPAGLCLGAVGQRADVRDVLVYRAAGPSAASPDRTEGGRGFAAGLSLDDLPPRATVATSSTRRQEQLLARRSDLRVVPIRGNVGTRLRKVADQPEWDATILAAAGLHRLGFRIGADGVLSCDGQPAPGDPQPRVPRGLLASFLEPEVMLPCVGQAAVGIEVRSGDERLAAICRRLDHAETHQCVLAERAFLHAMGGGCQSPVAAYAQAAEGRLRVRAVSFRAGLARHGEITGPLENAAALGARLALDLGGG